MAEEKQGITRRRWGKALAGTAAVSAGTMLGQAQNQGPPSQAPGQAPGGQAPAQPAIGPRVAGVAINDQLVFGGIGLGNRGMHDLRQLLSDPRVRFVAIADVRDSAGEIVKSTVDNYYKNSDCVMYRDPAELLARKDVDCLLIATSDRWHGPMAMWAAQSGKDM